MSATISNGTANTSNTRQPYNIRVEEGAVTLRNLDNDKTVTLDITNVDAASVLTEAEAKFLNWLLNRIDNETVALTANQRYAVMEMRRKIEMDRAGEYDLENPPVESAAPVITHITAVVCPPATNNVVTQADIVDLALPVAPTVAPQTNDVAPSTHADLASQERDRLAATLYGASVQSACTARQWTLIQSDNPEDKIAGFLEVSEAVKAMEFWQINYRIPATLSECGVIPSPVKLLCELGAVPAGDGSVFISKLKTIRDPRYATWREMVLSGWARYREMHRVLRAKNPDQTTWEEKGIRTDESILAEMAKTKPIRVESRPIDRRLNGNMLRDVIEGLEQAARDAHTKLIHTIDKADQAIKTAMDSVADQEGRDEAEKKRIASCRTAIASAVETFKSALARAEEFDCTMDVQDLLAALKAAIQANASAFNARYRSRRTDRGGFVKPAPSVS